MRNLRFCILVFFVCVTSGVYSRDEIQLQKPDNVIIFARSTRIDSKDLVFTVSGTKILLNGIQICSHSEPDTRTTDERLCEAIDRYYSLRTKFPAADCKATWKLFLAENNRLMRLVEEIRVKNRNEKWSSNQLKVRIEEIVTHLDTHDILCDTALIRANDCRVSLRYSGEKCGPALYIIKTDSGPKIKTARESMDEIVNETKRFLRRPETRRCFLLFCNGLNFATEGDESVAAALKQMTEYAAQRTDVEGPIPNNMLRKAFREVETR